MISKENHVLNSDLNESLSLLSSKEQVINEQGTKLQFQSDRIKSMEQEKEMLMNAYKQYIHENEELKIKLNEVVSSTENEKVEEERLRQELSKVVECVDLLEEQLQECHLVMKSQEQQNDCK
jgi:chromosome segregation ATPase